MMNFDYNSNIIKVIGIGGAGRRNIENLIDNGSYVSDYLLIDEDKYEMELSSCKNKICIGDSKCDKEDFDIALLMMDYEKKILKFCENTGIIFIICGTGGKITQSVAPAIIDILKKTKILVSMICIKPFEKEDEAKHKNSKECILKLNQMGTNIFLISNERALNFLEDRCSNIAVYKYVNNQIMNIINGLLSIINMPGLINIDFTDLRTLFLKKGLFFYGEGYAEGENGAKQAIYNALFSPFIESAIENVTSVVVQITSGIDITMREVEDIINEIKKVTSSDVDIISGIAFDSESEGIKVVLLAKIEDISDKNNYEKTIKYVIENTSNKNISSLSNLPRNKTKENCNKTINLQNIKFKTKLPKNVVTNSYGIINFVMYDEKFQNVVNDILSRENESKSFDIGDSTNPIIKVHINSPIATINNDTREFYWNEQALIFPFYFYIPANCKLQNVPFDITVYIDNVITTTLVISVGINSTDYAAEVRRDFKHAFVSYSSKDIKKAAMIVQGIRQARPDMKVFFDVSSLKNGDLWEKTIVKELEKADVLFLLWSTNSKDSEWVNKEWKYIYDKKGINYIEPIPLEPNAGKFLPKELAEKHCNDLLVYIQFMED